MYSLDTYEMVTSDLLYFSSRREDQLTLYSMIAIGYQISVLHDLDEISHLMQ